MVSTPSKKYSSKWESYPNRGEDKKNVWNHHLGDLFAPTHFLGHSHQPDKPWYRHDWFSCTNVNHGIVARFVSAIAVVRSIMDTKNWDTVFKNQESPFPNHVFFCIVLHMFCDITRKFALMLNLQQTMLPYHKLKRLEISYSETVNFERSCHQTSLSSHATACKNTATISLKI